MSTADWAVTMRPSPARVPARFISAALFFVSTIVRADAPPAPGQKLVEFRFTVHGASAKAPDQVLFAYPCGTSSGRPTATLTLVEDGKAIPVGRRGGECTLFTTSKAKYDEWKATYVPNNEMTDPTLDAFAQSSVKCTGRPSPSFTLPQTDSRSAIDEALDVTVLSSTACTIVARSTRPPREATASTTPGSTGNPPTGAAPPVPTDNPRGAPSTAGDPTASASEAEESGCSMSGHARMAAPWVVAFIVPLIAFGSRRRRKDAR